MTIVSLVTGVTKGMKILSNFNLILAAALLLFILIVGPTQFLLRDFVQSIGAYLQNVVGLSFNVTAQQGAAGEEWQGAWTTFYWAGGCRGPLRGHLHRPDLARSHRP